MFKKIVTPPMAERFGTWFADIAEAQREDTDTYDALTDEKAATRRNEEYLKNRWKTCDRTDEISPSKPATLEDRLRETHALDGPPMTPEQKAQQANKEWHKNRSRRLMASESINE